jgi:hypothetical protein
VRASDGTCTVHYTPPSSVRDSGALQHRYNVQLALLGSGIVSPVKAGENSGRALKHEFVAYALLTAPLTPQAGDQPPGGDSYVARFGASAWPKKALPTPGRSALVAWVSRSGDEAPLQSAGGWLND